MEISNSELLPTKLPLSAKEHLLTITYKTGKVDLLSVDAARCAWAGGAARRSVVHFSARAERGQPRRGGGRAVAAALGRPSFLPSFLPGSHALRAGRPRSPVCEDGCARGPRVGARDGAQREPGPHRGPALPRVPGARPTGRARVCVFRSSQGPALGPRVRLRSGPPCTHLGPVAQPASQGACPRVREPPGGWSWQAAGCHTPSGLGSFSLSLRPGDLRP